MKRSITFSKQELLTLHTLVCNRRADLQLAKTQTPDDLDEINLLEELGLKIARRRVNMDNQRPRTTRPPGLPPRHDAAGKLTFIP